MVGGDSALGTATVDVLVNSSYGARPRGLTVVLPLVCN
jgi:hypothetical protein